MLWYNQKIVQMFLLIGSVFQVRDVARPPFKLIRGSAPIQGEMIWLLTNVLHYFNFAETCLLL